MTKIELKERLQDLKFSVAAVVVFAEGKLDKGSYEQKQLSMMDECIRKKFDALIDAASKREEGAS